MRAARVCSVKSGVSPKTRPFPTFTGLSHATFLAAGPGTRQGGPDPPRLSIVSPDASAASRRGTMCPCPAHGLLRIQPHRQAGARHVLLGLAHGVLAEMEDGGGEHRGRVTVADA